MISRDSLTQYFASLLNPAAFDDYAPNGLQLEGSPRVKKLAFAVSATQDSIREALAWGAQGLVVHHGLFWKHQGARTLTGGWGQRVMSAVRADLSVWGYHLPLDAHIEVGNAVALAEALGLTDVSPFALYKKQPLGARALLPKELSAQDFQRQLERVLGHSVVMATHDPQAMIKSIGIITGGANNEWTQALEAGLDAYLTGEISEYNWHDCREAKLHYFAGGHHATEKFGIQKLMERVRSEFTGIEVMFFDSPNPA